MKKILLKFLTITCILSIYGYSNPVVLNNNENTSDNLVESNVDEIDLKLLEADVRALLEQINAIMKSVNGIYSYALKDDVDPKIKEYNEKRKQFVEELNKLPEGDARRNNINMYPVMQNVIVNDSNNNGITDDKDILEYEKIYQEINEKKGELDNKLNENSIINPQEKEKIINEINELNEKIKDVKENVKKLQSTIYQVDYIKKIIESVEYYSNDVIVNDIDSNDKIDSKEIKDSKDKINELDVLEKNINNSENSLGDIISSLDKEKIDNEKNEYNEKLDIYKKEIKSLSDLIEGSNELKNIIDSKQVFDLATVIVNDIDNNGKKDSDEVSSISNIFENIKEKSNEIDILNSANKILTRDEKRNVNNKIDEYNRKKQESKNLLDSLNDKIKEKEELMKEFLELKNFEKYDLNKVESEVVREKLNEKIKDLEELLEYLESNKEKINNKIDEVNNKEIQEYDELDSYLNHLDIFVKDEYVDILNKVKENINIIKKKIDYIKANDSIKKELDEKLSKEHIDFTKEELKKYYSELKSVLGNLDGNLIDSAKYVYAFLYDDISIKDRFDDNYYFKVNLGATLPNLLNQLVNKDKIYAKHIVNNVQIGFNKKIDNSTDLKLGAFFEYSNDISNQVAFGMNLKNKYLTLFGRYRLSILDKEVLNNKEVLLNNNIDLYISSDYSFKIKNLEISPKVGIYLVTSLGTKLENNVILKSRVYGGIEISNKLSYMINDYKIYNNISLKGFYNEPILKRGNKQLETINKLYLSYNILFGFDKQIYDRLRVGASVELNGRYDVFYGISNNNVNLKLATNISYLFK